MDSKRTIASKNTNDVRGTSEKQRFEYGKGFNWSSQKEYEYTTAITSQFCSLKGTREGFSIVMMMWHRGKRELKSRHGLELGLSEE